MYDVFIPELELLKNHITEITVLKESDSYPKEYFAFPHNVNSIVFYKDAVVSYNNFCLEITPALNESTVLIIGKYVEPLLVKYNGYVNEIAVNFTPTGINYFFEENLNKDAFSPIQILNNSKLTKFSNLLFNNDSHVAEKIKEVENFFVQNYINKDLQLIEKIIDVLENDKTIQFKVIAKTLNISTRNLNRLFHKYIGCSPKDYKKIIRFRSAINDYHSKGFNLTETCLNNEYYDSPHFTREFKRLTKMNPKSYFKNLTFESNFEFPYIFK